jgi:hypothetical protein
VLAAGGPFIALEDISILFNLVGINLPGFAGYDFRNADRLSTYNSLHVIFPAFCGKRKDAAARQS